MRIQVYSRQLAPKVQILKSSCHGHSLQVIPFLLYWPRPLQPRLDFPSIRTNSLMTLTRFVVRLQTAINAFERVQAWVTSVLQEWLTLLKLQQEFDLPQSWPVAYCPYHSCELAKKEYDLWWRVVTTRARMSSLQQSIPHLLQKILPLEKKDCLGSWWLPRWNISPSSDVKNSYCAGGSLKDKLKIASTLSWNTFQWLGN